MLSKFLISKKELAKFKISPRNPLGLTSEKITRTPRVFNTVEIKEAISNILLIDPEENILSEVINKTMEYVVKDLFLYMHQTGLYNRQLKLWNTIANLTKVSVFQLQKGIIKREPIDVYWFDFFVDDKFPSIVAVLNNQVTLKDDYKAFKLYMSKALFNPNSFKLKGFLYFTNQALDERFSSELNKLTNVTDPISKYESALSNEKGIRLNIINFSDNNQKIIFKPAYPELKQSEVLIERGNK